MKKPCHVMGRGQKMRAGLIWWILGIVLLLVGCNTQPPKVYRVGILSGMDAFAGIADGFKAKMTALGYAEGKNIIYDLQKAGDPAQQQQVVKKFVADKVDLILAFPNGPVMAAKTGTQGTNIPVLFAESPIEESNVVENLRQPGGNITGVRIPGTERLLKRFDILLDLKPQAKRVWITYDMNYPITKSSLEALRPAASSKGIVLVEVPVTSVEEIKANLEARAASGAIGMDAILLMHDVLSHTPAAWQTISKFAAEHKVPIAGSPNSEAETGAVFSFAPDNIDIGELAAPLANKILKGTPAGTIPVVSAEPRLRLNYKLAQELGLRVREGLLNQATEVIR